MAGKSFDKRTMERSRYEDHIALAIRHNWTPEQVGALPADFVDDLIVYYQAEKEHAEAEQKRAEREAKRNGKRST